MTLKKVEYTCKNCGWKTSIRVEWSDLSPKKCGNGKCGANFRAFPDKLDVKRPKVSKSKPSKKSAKTKKTSKKSKSETKKSSPSLKQSSEKESSKGHSDSSES